MNILIVEDSPLENKRITRMVREAMPKAQTFSFTDAIEARDTILSGEWHPDVAFLDIDLPKLSGMEFASILMQENPCLNIIFTTAFSSYMKEAFDLFASGYLLKPFSLKDIQNQFEHLRYPVKDALSPDFFAKTIGTFDFFYQGKPVIFALSRSKEALAYLIDRQGASVTKRELFTILFEDSEYSMAKQDYMKKIMRSLRETLTKINGEDILLHSRNSYAIDMSRIMTDLDDRKASEGTSYMEQYSWADGWRL